MPTTPTAACSAADAPPPVPPEWIIDEGDKLAVEAGCWFEAHRGERVIAFIEGYLRQPKGLTPGAPMVLLEWQRSFLMRLFSWLRPNGTRRFRTAYLEIPKKNGKTTLIAALADYMLVADLEEIRPEIFVNAVDRSQARNLYVEASEMAMASPQVAKRVVLLDYKNRLTCPGRKGFIQANSRQADTNDGASPSLVIFDELHLQPDSRLYDVFRNSGLSRRQPLRLDITTAGDRAAGVWYEQREKSEGVIRGTIPDWTHLGVIYRALPDDDLDDPATWQKANPSWGVTFKADEFKLELEEAKRSREGGWAKFKRYRFNIIASGDDKFFDMDRWAECKAEPGEPGKGVLFHAGLDLSKTTDLTAFAAIFGDEALGYGVHTHYWLPKDNIEELERVDRIPYRAYADAGLITLTPGNVVDYGFIRTFLVQRYTGRIAKLGIDPQNANKLALELRDEDGFPVEWTIQGPKSLNAPTKELDRLIRSGRIRHGNNRLLSWQVGNAIGLVDSNGNIKLDKKRSRDKIDGVAALVNAFEVALKFPARKPYNPSKPGFYV